MTDDHYELSLAVFDAGEARDKLRAATTVILNLEKAYADAIQDAADSEAAYRLATWPNPSRITGRPAKPWKRPRSPPTAITRCCRRNATKRPDD
jgi:hypothetical protein